MGLAGTAHAGTRSSADTSGSTSMQTGPADNGTNTTPKTKKPYFHDKNRYYNNNKYE